MALANNVLIIILKENALNVILKKILKFPFMGNAIVYKAQFCKIKNAVKLLQNIAH